jgi:hypothetical protein
VISQSRSTHLLTVIAILATATDAGACPICDTPAGAQVRDAIFDGNFLANVAATLAPFPILGAIVSWIYFGGRHDLNRHSAS